MSVVRRRGRIAVVGGGYSECALRVADPVLGRLFQRVGDRAKAGLATTLAARGDGAPSLDRSLR